MFYLGIPHFALWKLKCGIVREQRHIHQRLLENRKRKCFFLRRKKCKLLVLVLLFIKYSDPIKLSRSLLYLICISVGMSSQEAGRYPAYKEMVAEYRWLNKCMYLFLFLICQHQCVSI